MVRLDMFACLFYRESPGCIIFFNAAGFKPRWQPWRTFLVRNCVLLFFQKNRCSKVNISFIFLPRMCRYFSWWSRAGKWVETSTQSSHGASKHIWPKYGRLKSSATGLLTKSPAYIMLLAGREVRIRKKRWPRSSWKCIFEHQVYKPFAKTLTSERASKSDTIRRNMYQRGIVTPPHQLNCWFSVSRHSK